MIEIKLSPRERMVYDAICASGVGWTAGDIARLLWPHTTPKFAEQRAREFMLLLSAKSSTFSPMIRNVGGTGRGHRALYVAVKDEKEGLADG